MYIWGMKPFPKNREIPMWVRLVECGPHEKKPGQWQSEYGRSFVSHDTSGLKRKEWVIVFALRLYVTNPTTYAQMARGTLPIIDGLDTDRKRTLLEATNPVWTSYPLLLDSMEFHGMEFDVYPCRQIRDHWVPERMMLTERDAVAFRTEDFVCIADTMSRRLVEKNMPMLRGKYGFTEKNIVNGFGTCSLVKNDVGNDIVVTSQPAWFGQGIKTEGVPLGWQWTYCDPINKYIGKSTDRIQLTVTSQSSGEGEGAESWSLNSSYTYTQKIWDCRGYLTPDGTAISKQIPIWFNPNQEKIKKYF